MNSNTFYLSADIKKRLTTVLGHIPNDFLFVSIEKQKLYILKNMMLQSEFQISTSKYGIGNKENSLQTPLGIHAITEKIGEGAPLGQIFIDRIDTGRTWKPGMIEDELVLTRILRLKGLEPGVNSGEGIDTFERYIYIHGTSKENQIGTPLSHGCICLRNNDIIKLFNTVMENTIVIVNT